MARQPSLAAQIAAVRVEMEETRPAGLVRHVERVLEEALDLAGRYDADPRRVELAAWGHDLYRAAGNEAWLALAEEFGVMLSNEDAAAPIMLHGPLAAIALRERFKVSDDDVLAAVRDHSSGLAEMPLIAKIILIADKVERRKRARAPELPDIRRLARRDLDTALLCWADWKWVEERRRAWSSYPPHWLARSAWVAAHHEEAGLPGRSGEEAFEGNPGVEGLEHGDGVPAAEE